MAIKYVDNFEFPAEAGFTGSASNKSTVAVQSYERKKPSLHDKLLEQGARLGFAEGGTVKMKPILKQEPMDSMDNANIQRKKDLAASERQAEFGNQPEVKPGYKKGGKLSAKGPKGKGPDAGAKGSGKVKYFEEGGEVEASGKDEKESRKKKMDELEDEQRKSMGLPPKQRKRLGGPVAAKGGGLAQMKAAADTEIGKHVQTPKPKGHGIPVHSGKPLFGKK